MATKVQIEYQEMEGIASALSDESTTLYDTYNAGRTAFDELKGKFVSPAATKFFNDTQTMLDRFEKLTDAMESLTSTANEIASTLHEVEENAKSEFSWLKEL